MALSKLTILNERYVLRNLLGEPGLYDATYLAWNLMKKETAVVVREFNPTFLMSRAENGETLIPTSGPAERLFDYGLNCFIREADATGLIHHPNVVHQQTYFKENGTAYSVSDYHTGATLSAVLQGQAGKLQERAAFAIIVPLLDGLIAGHRKGLIHGRLSPDQIFLTKSGRPMILRFHVTQILLARRCGRAADIATPGFTPPELLLAEGKKGPWSDVYSSAATLYSIITGKTPPRTMRRYDRDPLPDILHKEPDISKGMKKVINRAMSMDWNDRPQTILELKQEILEHMPATSQPYLPAVDLGNTDSASATKESEPVSQDIAGLTLPTQNPEIGNHAEPKLQEAQLSARARAKERAKKNIARDIALLSQEALTNITPANTTPDKKEDKAPLKPLSLEEIDSERAHQWLPKLKQTDGSGDGIPFKKEPVIDTNPLGPLANDAAFLTPRKKEGISVTAHEIPSTPSPSSPLKQVVNSATANRTRKMSIAAIAACILLFVAAGLWKGLNTNNNGSSLPNPVQAAETPVSAVAPSSLHSAYMGLLTSADSLQKISHTYMLLGDTIKHIEIQEKTRDVYEQMLELEPADSFAITQIRRLDALAELMDTRTTPPQSTSPTDAVKAESVQRYLAFGDSLLARGRFEAARNQYDLALTQEPANQHAKDMLVRIGSEMAALDQRREFQNHIRQGEIYLKEELLEQALESFTKAQMLDPTSTSAQTRLQNVNGLIEKRDQANLQFEQLKAQGDQQFAQNSFSSALVSYEAAQLLRPEDLYIEDQIEQVKEQLSELERIVKQRDTQFDRYKETADSLFGAGNLEEAYSTYRIAEALNPMDQHIKDRLASIEEENQTTTVEKLPVDEEGIFIFPDTAPEIIDQAGLINLIEYPAEARRNGIEGMVVVKMLVDENGDTSRMEILKGIQYDCDREALRVLRRAKFKPATHNGQPVKSWHTHPIRFKILK